MLSPFGYRTAPAMELDLMKPYICLSVCMSSKAVHLELVSDLSAVAFIKALRRFTRSQCGYTAIMEPISEKPTAN